MTFEVEESYKGRASRTPIRMRLATYVPRPIHEPWRNRLFGARSLDQLAADLRNLEREFADVSRNRERALAEGELLPEQCEERREQLRERILSSPAYHKGTHVLLRIEIGSPENPYRSADVLIELGSTYVLMINNELLSEELMKELKIDPVRFAEQFHRYDRGFDVYADPEIHALLPALIRAGERSEAR